MSNQFAHGKVDPKVAGAKGGRAPRTPAILRALDAKIAASNNGAALLALRRDLARELAAQLREEELRRTGESLKADAAAHRSLHRHLNEAGIELTREIEQARD